MPDPFYPQTPREALLEIRGYARKLGPARNGNEYLEAMCDAGLGTNVGFELPDQLADRLAEAHGILRDLGTGDPAKLSGLMDRVPAALALPPDLEAMVERRIGTGQKSAAATKIEDLQQALRDVRFHIGMSGPTDGTQKAICEVVDEALVDDPLYHGGADAAAQS